MYNVLRFTDGRVVIQYAGKIRRHEDQITDEEMAIIGAMLIKVLESTKEIENEEA